MSLWGGFCGTCGDGLPCEKHTPTGLAEPIIITRALSAGDAKVFELHPRLVEMLKRCDEHLLELEDAWLRGVMDEHDGKGGTRSNRNCVLERDVASLLHEVGDA